MTDENGTALDRSVWVDGLIDPDRDDWLSRVKVSDVVAAHNAQSEPADQLVRCQEFWPRIAAAERDLDEARAEVEQMARERTAALKDVLKADVENERLREALRQIEGSPRAGIGCVQQAIAREALGEQP